MAVSAEHLEHEERDVLPVWLPGLSMSRRKELAGLVRVRSGMEAGRHVRAAAAAELERTQDVKF